jgi:hypothetical protein
VDDVISHTETKGRLEDRPMPQRIQHPAFSSPPPYPRLSAAAKPRVLQALQQEVELHNLRPAASASPRCDERERSRMTHEYLPANREYTEAEVDLIMARKIEAYRQEIAALEAEKRQIDARYQPDAYWETSVVLGVLRGSLNVATEQPERYRRQLRENLARGIVEARFLPEAAARGPHGG